jgi:anti-sigma factor RsiW
MSVASNASNRPNPEDLPVLSAYLDGRLTPAERTALEKRLAAEPVLQAELTSLQETVRLLRALPRLKAPRNFTLDPAVYGRQTPGRVIFFRRVNRWQLASAASLAASLALVIVGLLVGFGSSGERAASPEQALHVQSPTLAVEESEQAAQQATSLALVVTVAPSLPPLTTTPTPQPTASAIPPENFQPGMAAQGMPTLTAGSGGVGEALPEPSGPPIQPQNGYDVSLPSGAGGGVPEQAAEMPGTPTAAMAAAAPPNAPLPTMTYAPLDETAPGEGRPVTPMATTAPVQEAPDDRMRSQAPSSTLESEDQNGSGFVARDNTLPSTQEVAPTAVALDETEAPRNESVAADGARQPVSEEPGFTVTAWLIAGVLGLLVSSTVLIYTWRKR